VVFVTHQLQYLPECDSVLVLDKGRQVDHGKYAEVVQRCELLRDMVGHATNDSPDDAEEHHGIVTAAPAKIAAPDEQPYAMRPRLMSILKPMSTFLLTDRWLIQPAAFVKKDKAFSKKAPSPLWHYITVKSGPVVWFWVVFVCSTAYCWRMVGDSWITFWTNNVYNQTVDFYLGIYALWVILFALFVFLRGYAFSKESIATGMQMHSNLLQVSVRP